MKSQSDLDLPCLQKQPERVVFGTLWIHHLPDYKVLALPKSKAIGDDKLNISQNIRFVSYSTEKIVEKEKILVTNIFSFSHDVF